MTTRVVCFPFIGDQVGGSHLSALGLIRALNGTMFRPLVVLHNSSGPLAQLLREERIDFEQAPVSSYLPLKGPRSAATFAHVASIVPRLSKYLRRKQVSIVHTNDGRCHITWGIAARLAGAKLVWHHRSDPSSMGLRWIAPWISSHVLAVSQFAVSSIEEAPIRANYSVAFSPFDIDISSKFDRSLCRAHLLQELGCGSEILLLGYVGSLVERKRPLLFVEMLSELKRVAPSLKYAGLLFGTSLHGMDRVVLERASALGVGGSVHLMGFRRPGEAWLAALDVLVVPAVNEPLARTIVEAMLLGTPVIAANSGGSPEVIKNGETGMLVPPDDAAAFSEAVLRLIAQPAQTQSIVEAARSAVRKNFSVRQHVQTVTSLYERLTGSRTP